MTSLPGNSDRSNLDAYLDDVLSAPQRAQMAHEIGVSRELQAEVELVFAMLYSEWDKRS